MGCDVTCKHGWFLHVYFVKQGYIDREQDDNCFIISPSRSINCNSQQNINFNINFSNLVTVKMDFQSSCWHPGKIVHNATQYQCKETWLPLQVSKILPDATFTGITKFCIKNSKASGKHLINFYKKCFGSTSATFNSPYWQSFIDFLDIRLKCIRNV